MNNNLQVFSNCIIKKYDPNAEHAEKSNLENEMFCFDKFSMDGNNPYCPNVMRMDNLTYAIERYSFPLGEAINLWPNNVKRMFFSITYSEFEKQINDILQWLELSHINHRDFNPSNLIFYEKERRIKLIDFYYSVTEGITLGTPGQLNWFYGKDDKKAAETIKYQVKEIYDNLIRQCEIEAYPLVKEIGKTYFDGSSTSQGVTYQPIDIPSFKFPYVVNTNELYKEILSQISITPESITDIGCSVGYFTFNLMRDFHLTKAYAYEADKQVNDLLKKIKGIFSLTELEVRNGLSPDSDIPESDITLLLNTHMWLYNQFGKEQTDKIVSNLIKKSKLLFFQTAGKESNGMYVLNDKEFSNKEETEKYLYSLGARKVYWIRGMLIHGGIRHLFKIEK